MATEIYVLHPGVGQNRPSDGASIRKTDGTFFSFLEQVFPDGQDRQSFFHGIVVPPALQLIPAVNVVFRLVFRQIAAAGAGNIYARIAYNNIVPPTNRDSPLTPVAAQTLAMPGLDLEAQMTFNVPSTTFASGQELLLSVERLGSDAINDTFTESVSLVRIDIEFPQTGGTTYTGGPVVDGHGGVLPGDTFSSASLQQMFDAVLFPYAFPTFDTFKLQSGPFGGPYVDIPTTIEVGETLPLGNPPPANSTNFVWTTSNTGNIVPNSVSVEDLTTPVNLGSGFPAVPPSAYLGINPTSLPPGLPYTYAVRASHAFRVWALNTRVPPYPPASPPLPLSAFYRDVTHNWVWLRYYGNDNGLGAGPLTPGTVPLLPNTPLTDGFAGSYVFPATAPAEYKYICYEAALPGAPATSFQDASTLLNVAMNVPYPVLVTNGFGVATTYNVHRTTFKIGGPLTIIVA